VRQGIRGALVQPPQRGQSHLPGPAAVRMADKAPLHGEILAGLTIGAAVGGASDRGPEVPDYANCAGRCSSYQTREGYMAGR